MANIGVLRGLLLIMTLLVIAAAPFADGTVYVRDWRIVPSVIAPSIMMMLVFALPLEITMSRVFMVDAEQAERERLRFVVRLEAFALVAMLIAWTPFIIKVVDFTPLS
jgi:hypothetical protein